MVTSSTDSRLLDVAIEHFGRLGLDGASTRAIARDAGTPMSSITYHFGGKEGLYLAAAEHIAQRMREWIGPALLHAEALCGADGSVADARTAIHAMVEGIGNVMLLEKTASISRFIVREQADPTEAFTRIYDGLLSHAQKQLAGLLRRVSGDRLSPDAARLRTLTLIGQVLVFRIARATVMASMGWTTLGPAEAAAVLRTVHINIDAILDQIERGDPA